MLFRETLAPETWNLFVQLSESVLLKDFYLAGGTALALQMGHRKSYDLDFFQQGALKNEDILEGLSGFEKLEIVAQSPRILVLMINNIKVDFVRHPYPLIDPLNTEGSLRLAAPKDIAAMKLHAVAGRGRKRDFTDLYFLLEKFTLKEMLSFYSLKYKDGNELMVIRSLCYFGDADADPEINFTGQTVNWMTIKETIAKAVKTL